jgi:8-amino-7-oxononanoate synthase
MPELLARPLPHTAAMPSTDTASLPPPVRFAGCDYLGLSRHPRLLHAARTACEHALSTSASRTTTGNTPEHDALEAELASFMGHQAALLLPEGYTANIAACQSLAARGVRTALVDARAHRSLLDAARACHLDVIDYPHRDAHAAGTLAAAAFARTRAPVAILTDSVFTASGRLAPLAELLQILPSADSALLADDCHALAVLGPRGRGSLAHFGLHDPRLLVTTTLAKGLGAAGGALLGTHAAITHARAHATVYICTTPTSPVLVAAAREGVRVLQSEPDLTDTLRANIARVCAVLSDLGLPNHTDPTPIFALPTDEDPAPDRAAPRAALAVERFARHGVLVPRMSYPGGPSPSYFRLSVSAAHTTADLDRLAAALRDARHALG